MKVLLTVILMIGLFVSCGSNDDGDGGDPGHNPGHEPDPDPDPDRIEWAETIQPIVADSCALVGCHADAPFLASEAAMKASHALYRLCSSDPAVRMPKPGSPGDQALSADERAVLIKFLAN